MFQGRNHLSASITASPVTLNPAFTITTGLPKEHVKGSHAWAHHIKLYNYSKLLTGNHTGAKQLHQLGLGLFTRISAVTTSKGLARGCWSMAKRRQDIPAAWRASPFPRFSPGRSV